MTIVGDEHTHTSRLDCRLASYPEGIDLVAVSYRSADDLSRLMAGLPDQLHAFPHPVTVHAAVVDPRLSDIEHAHDDLAALRAAGIEAHLHVHSTNVGYNVACNTAGAEGRRRVVLCCNADVAFDSTSPVLAALYERLTRNEDWAIAGPRQVDARRRLTAAGIFGTLRRPEHRFWHRPDRGQASDLRADAVTVAGSCIAIRRDVWDELTGCSQVRALVGTATGPFLETKHWWGETWACYHAAAHGYDRVYDGTVWCFHEHAQAPGSLDWAKANQNDDRRLFRAVCDAHGLTHD